MPSHAESLILFWILCAIFVSVPVAVILRRRHDRQRRMMHPLPPGDDHGTAGAETTAWTGRDAGFAVMLALAVGLLMGPGVSLLIGYGQEQGSVEIPEDPKIQFSVSLFVTQIFFQTGVIGLILGYLAIHRRYRLTWLFGLRLPGAIKTLGLAVLWLLAAYLVILLVTPVVEPLLQRLTGLDLKPQGLVESAPSITDPTTRFLMFVTLCIGAPLMEEIVFRGVLYNVAARWVSPGYAAVATSLLFGVIHNNLLSFIPLSLLGMCFAQAYRRTGSLAVPILMHSMFNCVSFLLITNGFTEVK